MSNYPSTPGEGAEDPSVSGTPTPHGQLHRSLSGSGSFSTAGTPQHHHQGTSYFSQTPSSPGGPRRPHMYNRSTSAASTTRRGARSTSVANSARDMLSEDDEDEDEDEDDVSIVESLRARRGKGREAPQAEGDAEDEDDDADLDPITLKERQSLINVEHPFGLPIWKPALYKKSRTVTRNADEALHSIPSAQAERHLLPGNVFWTILFGWWLALVCFVLSGLLYFIPQGGRRFSTLIFGLGWYIAWPFGKYVEGEGPERLEVTEDEESGSSSHAPHERQTSDSSTVRGVSPHDRDTVREEPAHTQSPSWNSHASENTSLLHRTQSGFPVPPPKKSYGATLSPSSSASSIGAVKAESISSDTMGKISFWIAFVCVIAPLMLFVSLCCWALIVFIPMAKLNWALIKHLFQQPLSIRFCSAPSPVVIVQDEDGNQEEHDGTETQESEPITSQSSISVKHPRLSQGQAAPSGGSTILLCTYKAAGLQYFKYTVGGVNIIFVNLMPVVFLVIFDGIYLLELVRHRDEKGLPVSPFLRFVASQALIFIMSLASVIPLSYFIGMAVASISAQSSIGMGAVINATFGSIIEIILYCIALTQGKGHLVEGSIVGSLLAGVLLMPGMSMCSSAVRRKEQRFNAKSAGVTSMMLIMAIVGTLAPTLFYQTYGNFQLICSGCPSTPRPGSDAPWICERCYYKHPDPVSDPFYQSTVKSLMYFCAAILVFSYLIGLWFSLHTHASQIWQNPQQVMHPGMELPLHNPNRMSIYHRLAGSGERSQSLPRQQSRQTLRRKPSTMEQADSLKAPPSPTLARRVSYATGTQPGQSYQGAFPQGYQGGSYQGASSAYPGVLDSVDHAVKAALPEGQPPNVLTAEDFTRAVAVATVSALRHQTAHSPGRVRTSGAVPAEAEGGGHGGHDAPSWSRKVSASVLLSCTFLYAIIAEILVDVVDVILEGSGIDEKFLGVTLFALVPNTTEFMNAMSFALNGNIALSMEIGSAYALQVCLLQIPAMVAFSAWYAPDKMGEVAHTFTLIFPRWDVIALVLSMFLMTYTYIEARSNYHRGSILVLSYLVLVSAFYYAPQNKDDEELDNPGPGFTANNLTEFSLNIFQAARWYLSSFF
ncbi:hypothetical protein EV714DRAFT_232814 [Schizophyllum commune]